MNFKITASLVLILLGLWIWLSNLNYLNFKRDWPLILIFIGLDLLLTTIPKKFKKSKKQKVLEDLEKGKITVEEAAEQIKNK